MRHMLVSLFVVLLQSRAARSCFSSSQISACRGGNHLCASGHCMTALSCHESCMRPFVPTEIVPGSKYSGTGVSAVFHDIKGTTVAVRILKYAVCRSRHVLVVRPKCRCAHVRQQCCTSVVPIRRRRHRPAPSNRSLSRPLCIPPLPRWAFAYRATTY